MCPVRRGINQGQGQGHRVFHAWHMLPSTSSFINFLLTFRSSSSSVGFVKYLKCTTVQCDFAAF